MTRRHLPPACRWLGVLMLLLRVLGPASPAADGAGSATLAAWFPGGVPLCHTPAPGEQAPAKPPAPFCQLCLACHGASQAPLLPVDALRLPRREGGLRLRAAAPPPATGPPPARRGRATPPTGPPAASV